MRKINRKILQVLSERFHISEELLIHCFDYSLIEIEGRGENIDLSGGTALRMRRLQRLAEHLDIDVVIAAILLERTERISHLEREIKALRQISPQRSSPKSSRSL